MKFVRFASAAHPDGAYGIIEGGRIEVVQGGLFDPIEKTGKVIPEADIERYLPPVDPPNIVAIGKNYADHSAEMDSAPPTEPLFFMKPTTSLVGHKGTVLLPKMAPCEVDYEAELTIVIGKTCRNVSPEEALDYVFGYTCGMDVSARDCQFRDGQWVRAKGFDTFCPLGPYVETDLDPGASRVRLRLNGETMQDALTSLMLFDCATLVSFLSRWSTLMPGTIILTGTPSGVGFARTPPVFLKTGDTCEIDIEGLGVLEVGIAEEG